MSLAEFKINMGEIEEELTNTSSFLKTQTNEFEELLKRFSIDNDQFGAIMSSFLTTTLQEVNKTSTTMALELLRLDKQSEEIDAKIQQINAQKALYDIQAIKVGLEGNLVTQQIAKIAKEMDKINKEIEMLEEDKLTEIENRNLVMAQKVIADKQALLIVRQTGSYDDKLLMAKAGEYAKMASMALNAGSPVSATYVTAAMDVWN